MWIGKPGKLTDRIDFLGTEQNCIHLIRGREAMLFGGGMSYIAPSLESQFATMEFDLEQIKYLVVPHSHFDHCGAVPYLKRKFPWMQILASSYSKEVFSKDKVVNVIANINKEMINRLGLQDKYEKLDLKFDGIHVDQVVGENDVIDIGGGIEAHFMGVPGHTKCSIALYIPKLKAIFPSDAAPCPTMDGSRLTYPTPQYNFPLYLESLKKLAAYEVEVCSFDHHGAFVGEEAKDILQQGLKRTEEFVNYVTKEYQQIGDLDKVARKIAEEMFKGSNLDFIDVEGGVNIVRTVILKILDLPG